MQVLTSFAGYRLIVGSYLIQLGATPGSWAALKAVFSVMTHFSNP